MLSLREELASINAGQPVAFRNLTLFPLFRTSPLPPRDYILLEDGIAQGLVRVTEVHAAGSVPELTVMNDADSPVLLLDGEELVGAKQNRVLNLSILVPAKQKCSIPVSCVESGRWRTASPEFSTSEHLHYGSARGQRVSQVTHSLRTLGSRLSFQERVWDELSAKASRLDGDSPTHAMGAIYTRHSRSLDEFLKSFHWQDQQAGAAFAISGSIVGLDLFDHPAVMQHYFSKLLRSFALDALDAPSPKSASISSDLLPSFLSKIADAPCFAENALGIGTDLRFTSNQVTGAALWARERFIHHCAFPNVSCAQGFAFQTRISRSRNPRWF